MTGKEGGKRRRDRPDRPRPPTISEMIEAYAGFESISIPFDGSGGYGYEDEIAPVPVTAKKQPSESDDFMARRAEERAEERVAQKWADHLEVLAKKRELYLKQRQAESRVAPTSQTTGTQPGLAEVVPMPGIDRAAPVESNGQAFEIPSEDLYRPEFEVDGLWVIFTVGESRIPLYCIDDTNYWYDLRDGGDEVILGTFASLDEARTALTTEFAGFITAWTENEIQEAMREFDGEDEPGDGT